MTLLLGVAGLCMTVLIGIGAIVWMTVVRLRDQRDANEVIPLEVAVCIRRENGDIIIRQRRAKSVLGLVIGFLLVLGCLAALVAQASDTTGLGLESLCFGFGLLILGALVAWVSARGFQEPDVAIKAANQTVEIRHGFLRGTQTWPFDAISGVVRQSRLREDILLNVAQFLIAPQHTSSHTNRTIIGLQHSDGSVVCICTATEAAAKRVPAMIAAALGKPIRASVRAQRYCVFDDTVSWWEHTSSLWRDQRPSTLVVVSFQRTMRAVRGTPTLKRRTYWIG